MASPIQPVRISLCPPDGFEAAKLGLANLLHACVLGGASVNFVLPFTLEQASEFWDTMAEDVANEKSFIFLADSSLESDGEEEVCGCVVMKPAWQPNGQHRADVNKMLVHQSYRRQGIGSRLLQALEVEARARGRWLLTLDTESDSGAQKLYAQEGYVVLGAIPDFASHNDGVHFISATFMYKHLGKP